MILKRVAIGAIAASAVMAAAPANALNIPAFIDGGFGEQGVADGTTLVIDGISMSFAGYLDAPPPDNEPAYAYFDAGNAGVGVCKSLSGSDQCLPGSDDNVTGATGSFAKEILGVTFNQDVTVSSFSFRNATHGTSFTGSVDIDLGDGGGYSSYSLALGGIVFFPLINISSGTEVLMKYNDDQFYWSGGEITPNITDVPLPAPFLLLGASIGIFGAMRRRRKAS